MGIDALREEDTRQHRHDGEREDKRPDEDEDHRHCHRPEHLPLHPLERQDRDVDDHDDQLPETGRLLDSARRLHDELEAGGTSGPGMVGDLLEDALDDDDRGIDDDPEVDRPEREQAGGDPCLPHADEAEHHRQRNRRGGHEPGAEIAEHDVKDDDDEEGPLEEVLPHRGDHPVDELRAVVDDLRLHPFRERAEELLKPVAQARRDGVAVFSHEHEAEAEDHLPLAAGRHRPLADLMADEDLADVADADRDAVARGDHDPADLLRIDRPADAVHEHRVA